MLPNTLLDSKIYLKHFVGDDKEIAELLAVKSVPKPATGLSYFGLSAEQLTALKDLNM